jgi:hypothetical protein
MTNGKQSDEVTVGTRDLHPGARVEVRTRFDGSWARGFELAEPSDGGWHVRRLSDGSVLPRAFPGEAVRRERRRETWWV